MQKTIGLVPAAGKASRISPLPFSKELYPIGFFRASGHDAPRPKPVCLNLLEKMRLAGVTEAYIVLRKDKWDIPAYLGGGEILNMNLAYLLMHLPYGVPFTLNQAFPFIRNYQIVFGFPDIIFSPDNVFQKLLGRLEETSADVVLGLFPAVNPQKNDMVGLDQNGHIGSILIKPFQTNLKYTWIAAVWKPSFTCFMNNFVKKYQEKLLNKKSIGDNLPSSKEVHIGEVVQSGIESGLIVEKVIFERGSYLDIGTSEDMMRAIKNQGLEQDAKSNSDRQ